MDNNMVNKKVLCALVTCILVAPIHLWSYDWPIGNGATQQQINGTFMEYREGSHFHDGIDIQAATDDMVHPVTNGTITLVRDNGTVRMEDAYGNKFWYIHLSQVDVSENQNVTTNSVIGTVSGHLHFGEGADGSEVNPLRSGALNPFSDTDAPTCFTTVKVFEDGTTNELNLTAVEGQVDFIIQAKDAISSPGHTNVAPYKVGYQIEGQTTWIYNIQFDDWLADTYLSNVYYPDSSTNSTYWYIPTNGMTANDYWNSEWVEDGDYTLRIRVYDISGNYDESTFSITADNSAGVPAREGRAAINP